MAWGFRQLPVFIPITWQGTTVLALSSTLAADADFQFTATTGGWSINSTLSVDTKVYRIATASLPVASTLAANSSLYRTASAAWPLASTLNAGSSLYRTAVAALPLTSTLASNATQTTRWQGSAVFPISSTLALNATTITRWQGSAVFQITFATPLFDADQKWGVNPAALSLTASLAATASITLQGTARYALATTLAVDSLEYDVAVPEQFNLASTLAANAQLYRAATAFISPTFNLSGDSNAEPPVEQEHFRFRTDADLVDNAPVWGSAEDDTTFWPGTNVKFRLRVGIKNESLQTPTGASNFQLMVSKNGGPFTAVTTSSTGVKSTDAGASADGDPITVPQLTEV